MLRCCLVVVVVVMAVGVVGGVGGVGGVARVVAPCACPPFAGAPFAAALVLWSDRHCDMHTTNFFSYSLV